MKIINKDKYSSKRLLRINDVVLLTRISKSYVYQLGNNGLFPQSIKLIPGGTSVAWIEGEILQWIDERIQERDSEVKAYG